MATQSSLITIKQSSIDTIKKAYIAYYGRPADSDGWLYWADQLDNSGDTLDEVLSEFGNSQEFVDRYSTLSNEELINNIYQQAFSRDADDTGMSFYLERLDSGEATLANIALQILEGAQDEDNAVLLKKLEVGDLVLSQTQDAGREFTGSAVADAVAELLSEVTLDSGSAQEHLTAFDEITEKMAFSQNSYQPVTLEEGYQVRHEQDLDRDGFVEIIKTTTYDDLGRKILIEEDTDGDGDVDQVFQWQYDEFGNMGQYTVDTDADGQADYIETSVYKGVTGFAAYEDYRLAQEAYQAAETAFKEVEELYHQDEEAHREEYYATHEVYLEALEAFNDAYSEPNQTYKDLYYTPNLNAPEDAPESPLSIIPAEPRSPHLIYTDDHVDDINLVSRTIDSDGDGNADYTLNYTYDEHDRPLSQQKDSDGDGLTDYSVSFQYRDPADMTDDVAASSAAVAELPIYNNAIIGWEIDKDGDGQTDEIASYQYNDKGWMTRYDQDSDGDGQLDSTIHYGYDDVGRMVEFYSDSNADGSVETAEIAVFNSEDTKIRHETNKDTDGDSFIDIITITDFNDEGEKTFIRTDNNVDGEIDEISYARTSDELGYFYNYELDDDISLYTVPVESHSYLVSDLTDEETSIDASIFNDLIENGHNSGHIYRNGETVTYIGSDGNVIEYQDHAILNSTRSTKDLDGDGTFEYVIENEFNDSGRETREYIDFDDDGTVDRFNLVSQIQDDNIFRKAYYSNDELMRLYESEYDSDGNQIRNAWDHDGDGEFDKEGFNVFNEQGDVTAYTEDSNGDGTIDLTSYFSYSYDEAGNQLTYHKDSNGDGIFDEMFTYTYDDSGNRTSYKKEVDSNNDGHIDYSQTTQYNADGDIILIGTYGSDDAF